MPQAKTVVGTHRAVGRTETGQARERLFQIAGVIAEVPAGTAHFPGRARMPLFAMPFGSVRVLTDEIFPMRREHDRRQDEAEDHVDDAPALKARNGLLPALARSRNRVVRPMLRKQKMKAQVRRSLIGATSDGHHGLVVVGEAVAAA